MLCEAPDNIPIHEKAMNTRGCYIKLKAYNAYCQLKI